MKLNEPSLPVSEIKFGRVPPAQPQAGADRSFGGRDLELRRVVVTGLGPVSNYFDCVGGERGVLVEATREKSAVSSVCEPVSQSTPPLGSDAV